MSAIETKELKLGFGLSIEPPLSPPVVNRSGIADEAVPHAGLSTPTSTLRGPGEAVEPAAAAKTFKVVVRLVDGNGVEVGDFRDFGTAMEGAGEVIEQFTNANGSWPFYAGRFIRPDLIVSVDLVAGL